MEQLNGDRLLTVIETMRRHGPPDVVAWLEEGFSRYIESGGNLEQILGLRAEGFSARSWRQEYLKRVRDKHLREAHELCSGESSWQRSVALENEIRRFQTIHWPMLRDHDTLPENLSRLRQLLFLACKTGMTMPGSVRQIHNICGNKDL